MPPSNLEIGRGICEDWERSRYGSVGWAHPEIDYEIADGPAPGRWTGVDGMARGWGDFLSAWEEAAIEVDEYRELDGERVLVLFSRSGRGKTSGVDLGEIRSRGATLFRLRDGKVVRLALYHGEEQALADLDGGA
jgi:hypothetical protein